jgi:hypothetical protein
MKRQISELHASDTNAVARRYSNKVRFETFLLLCVVLAHAYLAVGPSSLFSGGWATVEVMLLCGVLVFGATLWVHSDLFLPDDYAIYWMPLAAWAGARLTTGILSALLGGGHFARGKGLFNTICVEPALVGILSSAYAIRFAVASVHRSKRARSALRILIALASALIAWVVPALPD